MTTTACDCRNGRACPDCGHAHNCRLCGAVMWLPYTLANGDTITHADCARRAALAPPDLPDGRYSPPRA